MKLYNIFQRAALLSVLTTMLAFNSANAQIVLEEVHDVLTIPEAAVHFEGDSTFVYLLHEDSNGKQYVPANIVTGLSDGINIEIKSGIEPTARLRGNEVIATTE